MTKDDRRTVLFFDFVLKSWHRKFPEGFAPISMNDALASVERLWKIGDAVRPCGGSETIYVSDVRILQRTACLLVNVSDRRASDPAFSDLDERTRRIVNKMGHEGLDTAAHVAISLRDDPPGSYRAVVEVALNVAPKKIERLLNQLFRIAAKHKTFRIEDPTGAMSRGKPKYVYFRPKIEFRGIPSKDFLDDLKNGTFGGMELIRYTNTVKPWDSHAYVVEEKSIVVIKANPIKARQKAHSLVQNILGANKSKYDEARITFNTDSGDVRSVKVNIDLTLPDDQYVKRDIIDGFSVPLPSSFASINNEIHQKMIDLIK